MGKIVSNIIITMKFGELQILVPNHQLTYNYHIYLKHKISAKIRIRITVKLKCI
jgi:hypothetical protein